MCIYDLAWDALACARNIIIVKVSSGVGVFASHGRWLIREICIIAFREAWRILNIFRRRKSTKRHFEEAHNIICGQFTRLSFWIERMYCFQLKRAKFTAWKTFLGFISKKRPTLFYQQAPFVKSSIVLNTITFFPTTQLLFHQSSVVTQWHTSHAHTVVVK